MTGPVSSPFFAAKIASSNAFYCWPFWNAGRRPLWFFEASSIEKRFATRAKDWPSSSAVWACSAFALVFVSTFRKSRLSGVAD